jgi:hypothetical protein
MSKTKIIGVTYGVLTRVEHYAELEVPVDADDQQIRDIANAHYDQLDGGEFYEDADYWERGETNWEEVTPVVPVGPSALADIVTTPSTG